MRLGYRDIIDLSNVAEPIKERIIAIESSSGISEDERDERVGLINKAMSLSVTHM